MASYQAKHRDPLIDTKTQAAIEQRGKELVGLGLIGIAAALALALASYSPDDPSYFMATDSAAQNLLGQFGATIAFAMRMLVGQASWAICAVIGAWGLRLVVHRGEDRVWRAVFTPVLPLVAALYLSTMNVPANWPELYGLGGNFGDVLMGILLHGLPLGTSVVVKATAALSFFSMIAIGVFVLGFDRAELVKIGRFLLVGVILLYAAIVAAGSRAAITLYSGARWAWQAAKARRARRAEAGDADEPALVDRAEPVLENPQTPAPQRTGLLARLPLGGARSASAAPAEAESGTAPEALTEDHIKARIAAVVRSRMGGGTSAAPVAPRIEPPVNAALQSATSVASAAVARRKGPPPLIAQTKPRITAPPQPLGADLPDTAHDYGLDGADGALELTPELAEEQLVAPQPVFSAKPRAAVVQHPARKPAQPSRQAQSEAQPQLQFDDPVAQRYEHPPLSLLTSPSTVQRHHLSDEALEENARMLENVLEDYGVKGDIVSVRPGPVVTMYELEPAPGLKASRVIGLADDIARSMSALSARVSTVPGRSVIGIELPNVNREKVVLREILATRDFGDGNQRLPLALGKDIGGDAVVANLAKMPHLLIAGTTGSGKSVAINTMILSLLYKLTPEECRLIMIDPKMLELSVYDGIPHLLSPVVTDPKKAVVALKWVVGEMEDRYRKMSKMGVRNIEGYNGRVRDALAKGEMFSRTVQTGFDEDTGEPIFETEEFAPELLPFIVVIVDEMADLMMVAGKEIEACIQRLAQMARASGIHLIMATQRPSVDVITGTIKANFPTRISFQVTSKVDSRTILGEQGAEQLLGMGDMLYMAGGAKITRVHGPFVSDEEVEEIVNYLKAFGPPDYMSGVVEGPDEDKESDIDLVLGLGGNTDAEDALYDTAVQIVIKDRKCSTSYIQRKLAIGYNKAARLVEQMEENGLVSPANHVGKREILVPDQQ